MGKARYVELTDLRLGCWDVGQIGGIAYPDIDTFGEREFRFITRDFAVSPCVATGEIAASWQVRQQY